VASLALALVRLICPLHEPSILEKTPIIFRLCSTCQAVWVHILRFRQ
jgi:hypothetical protein